MDFQRSQSLSGLSLTRTGSYLGAGGGGESSNYSIPEGQMILEKESIINNKMTVHDFRFPLCLNFRVTKINEKSSYIHKAFLSLYQFHGASISSLV